MGTDTVEEPAVVADDDSTAGKGLKTFLQGTEGIDVDIIRRLVEQQYIAFLFEGNGQVQTVALTTREHAALLLLISSAEIKTTQIGTHIHIAAAHTDGLIAAAHHLIDALIGIDVLMLLIDIGELDSLANIKGAGISLFEPHDESEERGLTRTIGADDTHDAVWRQVETEVAEERFLGIGLGNMRGDDDLVAQTRTVGDVDLQFLLFLFLFFVEHLIIGVQTGLTLGVTGFRCHTHPLQLTLQRLTALRSLLLLLGQTL